MLDCTPFLDGVVYVYDYKPSQTLITMYMGTFCCTFSGSHSRDFIVVRHSD